MKVKVKGVRCIHISGEYIKLDALLKFASLVSTGGEAKNRIINGEVSVDREICNSRGKKIKPGNIVCIGTDVILVRKNNIAENV